ncbi:hypothetical protein [Saccharomonospora cyanea]|uniref:Uncharacterized protein n=1 Tax=Saccharomonospora cyanea NA-134 TaxID=882082 RepID=H5XG54_9PSEU|nr:hypothetical protein [Saccharomonospora cyanea]EHR62636.1 hypothetical protein SaccyDRAFT_3809 [Saccharomonospora cyanea NA-134]
MNRYILVKVEQTATGVADFYTVVDTSVGRVIARGSIADMSAVRDALNAANSGTV